MHIKVLQTLRVFALQGAIDIQDLKDLKTAFPKWLGAGQARALRFAGRFLPLYRRAGACPPRVFSVFVRLAARRETGPRPTVSCNAAWRSPRLTLDPAPDAFANLVEFTCRALGLM